MNNNIMKVRIAQLRVGAKLSQQQLAVMLSEITKRKDLLTTSTISSWESGRRRPSPSMIRAMAKLFDVTEHYIMGLSDDPHSTEVTNADVLPDNKLLHPNTTIEKVDTSIVSRFDGLPLFVTFKDTQHQDQWGIYNDSTHLINMRDFSLKINSETIDSIYTFSPYLAMMSTLPLNFQKMMDADHVYVTMLSSDPQIQRMYNGWFAHNEMRSCLINKLGLTLSYDGLNVSYYAFSK